MVKQESAAIATNWSRTVLPWVYHTSDTGRNRGFIRQWGLLRGSWAPRSRCRRTLLLMIMMLFTVTIVTLLAGRNIDTIETQQEFLVVQDMRTTKAQPNAGATHKHSTSRHQEVFVTQNSTGQNLSRDGESTRPTPTLDQGALVANFSQKYQHHYGNNTEEFLSRLEEIVNQEWKQSTMIHEIRESLRQELREEGSVKSFMVAKSNTPATRKMNFYFSGKPQKMPRTLWQSIPNDVMFTSGQFESCSVVGSSGILRGSGCGQQIDQSQIVFRFNIAPVEGFEADVGSKTNFTTLNPSIVTNKMNSLKTKDDIKRFQAALRQFRGSKLWLPAFAVSYNLPLMVRISGAAANSKAVSPILGQPDHFLAVSRLWKKIVMKDRTWPTTGLYLILSLFDVCDRINVFGFWPYERAFDGSQVPYHYHNNITGMHGFHNFDTEFKTLVNLYEQGFIKMHFGSCL